MDKQIKILALLASLLLLPSCVDRYIDDDDRHYESGTIAFENFERALASPINALQEAVKLDGFISYIDQNSQNDGSVSLETWQHAETSYFPENRLRNDGDLWYIASSSDTVWTINTNGQAINEPGSVWELNYYKDPSAMIITRVGPKIWELDINGLREVIYPESFYCQYNFSADGELRIDAGNANGYSLTGSVEISVGSYYTSSYAHILSGTLDTPLWYSLIDGKRGFTQGDFTFDITRINDGKTLPVEVTITPTEGGRQVAITYKNDTVTFELTQ